MKGLGWSLAATLCAILAGVAFNMGDYVFAVLGLIASVTSAWICVRET